MKRWIFVLVLTASFLHCETSDADPPTPSNESVMIVARLDQVLRRLDAIELRLTQLEFESQLNQEWWVDKHGVMRTGFGRPIGFWGIDGPVAEHPF